LAILLGVAGGGVCESEAKASRARDCSSINLSDCCAIASRAADVLKEGGE
jgi:hypothetical protein